MSAYDSRVGLVKVHTGKWTVVAIDKPCRPVGYTGINHDGEAWTLTADENGVSIGTFRDIVSAANALYAVWMMRSAAHMDPTLADRVTTPERGEPQT